ncbi:gliding motility-associated C-terminal domain-containing protein [Flavisolibacter sp. BT320]|nr:gliding motility-associated C-terminal domain-containing protein [Flavisolibacter longurius]
MKSSLVLLFLLLTVIAQAQPVCPPNIGFENGTFGNWQRMTGTVASDGTPNLLLADGEHYIYRENGRQPELDPYGKFPVTAPNGSQYSVRLGIDKPGRKAEQLAYVFSVPASADAFSIIFNYAIVLQNPSHQAHEQPRFTVKVFNETRAEYIECSSFDFVAGYNQPGFLVSDMADSVLYKPWSSVSINLSTFKGERVRLEFTVNDCTRGAHFGYAYFDVVEKCTNTIKGNIFCPPGSELTLSAPTGFADYQWYTGDFSQKLGTGSNYTIQQPKVGDSFAVELLPFAYLGCRDTFYTKISSSSEPMDLVLPDSLVGCASGLDLTAPSITRGSSPFLELEYFSDASASLLVPYPKQITQSGDYYIRGTNRSGCLQTKKISVSILPPSLFGVSEPPVVAFPDGVNLTLLPDNRQLDYSYWANSDLTVPIPNPAFISQSGVYYIKGTDVSDCFSVQEVTVKVQPKFFVPTAFTPNRDGRNDRFLYQVQGGLKTIRYFKVFNRWGVEVFSSTRVGEGWDGTYNGKDAETGAYVWLLKGETWLNNSVEAKGTVVLIR